MIYNSNKFASQPKTFAPQPKDKIHKLKESMASATALSRNYEIDVGKHKNQG